MSATPALDSGRPPQSVRAQPRQSDPDWKAWFSRFAHETAQLAGKPGTFLLAVAVVVVWAVSGPFFGFNDTWQLVINTGTTILTFLMVFLIQNTQNRDTLALQLKLTELVLTMKGARDRFATIEDLSDEELEKLHDECRRHADRLARSLERRRKPRPDRSADR